MPTNTNFLTAKEASELLKLAVKTLAMMRSDGTGPKFLKPSGKILYRIEDLEEWAIKRGKFLSSQQANLLTKRLTRAKRHDSTREKYTKTFFLPLKDNEHQDFSYLAFTGVLPRSY